MIIATFGVNCGSLDFQHWNLLAYVHIEMGFRFSILTRWGPKLLFWHQSTLTILVILNIPGISVAVQLLFDMFEDLDVIDLLISTLSYSTLVRVCFSEQNWEGDANVYIRSPVLNISRVG